MYGCTDDGRHKLSYILFFSIVVWGLCDFGFYSWDNRLLSTINVIPSTMILSHKITRNLLGIFDKNVEKLAGIVHLTILNKVYFGRTITNCLWA